MSTWTNPDGSTSVGIKEDFVLFQEEPKEEPVKKENPKKKTTKKK